jgi:hypothetical protein
LFIIIPLSNIPIHPLSNIFELKYAKSPTQGPKIIKNKLPSKIPQKKSITPSTGKIYLFKKLTSDSGIPIYTLLFYLPKSTHHPSNKKPHECGALYSEFDLKSESFV